MRYWPISTIASSPMMPAPYALEVAQIPRRAPSERAFYSCFDVAKHTQPTPSGALVIIESEGAPARQAYTGYPSFDEWFRLERSAVIEANGDFFIMIDGLH